MQGHGHQPLFTLLTGLGLSISLRKFRQNFYICKIRYFIHITNIKRTVMKNIPRFHTPCISFSNFESDRLLRSVSVNTMGVENPLACLSRTTLPVTAVSWRVIVAVRCELALTPFLQNYHATHNCLKLH